jgi:hypothetical protein
MWKKITSGIKCHSSDGKSWAWQWMAGLNLTVVDMEFAVSKAALGQVFAPYTMVFYQL